MNERRVSLGELEGCDLWIPAGHFTVDGISYDFRSRGACYLQPMIALKVDAPVCRGSHITCLSAPHVASTRQLQAMRKEFPEWRDLTWDPDIRL